MVHGPYFAHGCYKLFKVGLMSNQGISIRRDRVNEVEINVYYNDVDVMMS